MSFLRSLSDIFRERRGCELCSVTSTDLYPPSFIEPVLHMHASASLFSHFHLGKCNNTLHSQNQNLNLYTFAICMPRLQRLLCVSLQTVEQVQVVWRAIWPLMCLVCVCGYTWREHAGFCDVISGSWSRPVRLQNTGNQTVAVWLMLLSNFSVFFSFFLVHTTRKAALSKYWEWL